MIDSPLFNIEGGIFLLGEENMKWKIIVDGNKSKVESKSHLIILNKISELSIFDNVTICNNLYKVKNTTTVNGSAISVNKRKINIYGGEISNNILEIYVDKNSNESILPEKMESNYIYEVKGAGISLTCSKLYMYGGIICYNEGINNTDISSNKNSTNNNSKLYGLNQCCLGIAILSENYSKLYLYKGEISNNYAKNNGKLKLVEPKENTITKLSQINNCIYGSALYLANSEFEMFDDFIIQNNSPIHNSILTIEKNCKISGKILSSIRGGQIYANATQIKIHGGTIQNSNNDSNSIINVATEEEEIKKSIQAIDIGGGIDFTNCKDIQINNLKIINCNSTDGGAIYLYDSSLKISNSELNNNSAQHNGGAIFSANSCEVDLYNTKIINNHTKENGGGIFSKGNLIIDGENNIISNNEAGFNGGGITFYTHCLVKNCNICNNKAKHFGGGICANGDLLLEKAKIYLNSCDVKEGGGGIYYGNSIILFDKNKIDSLVYDNSAATKRNNFSPEIN